VLFSSQQPQNKHRTTIFASSVDGYACRADNLRMVGRWGLVVYLALFSVLTSHADHLEYGPHSELHLGYGNGTNFYQIAPPASWVKPVKPFTSESQLVLPPGPVGERLVDIQIDARRGGDVTRYYGYEYSLNTTDAVSANSTIEIEIDPTYERLTVHHILIKRGNVVLNKLDDSRTHVFQREKALDAMAYNGRKSLVLVLQDVRVGDIINYAYSRSGDNPAFGKLREFAVPTQWQKPVNRLHTRVLARSQDDLIVRSGDTQVEVQAEQLKDAYVMSFDGQDVPALPDEPQVPTWRKAQPYIVFSDIRGWEDVVDWEFARYQSDSDVPEELQRAAEKIKAEHIDRANQIGAALRWVQNEVRYLAVDFVVNSHKPALPGVTLERRFGNSKDKAMLLIALLGAMGIDASPALVNSARALQRTNNPFRLHAFDHVIVHVVDAGESHWLDATDTHQYGQLGEFSEPDFGKALILAPGVKDLTAMLGKRTTHRYAVTKTLVWEAAPATAATLTVKTQRFGAAAESARRLLVNEDSMKRREHYEDYYHDYFGPNNMLGKVQFEDLQDNSLTTTEEYRVRDIWNTEKGAKRELRVYGDEIFNSLEQPDHPHRRTQPFQISHPRDITETWRLELPRGMRVDELEVNDHTAWLMFDKSYSLDESGRQLTVTMRYRTLTNTVEATEMTEYVEAVARIRELANFYVNDSSSIAETTVVEAQGAKRWMTMVNAVSVLTGLLIVTLFVLFVVVRRLNNTIDDTRHATAEV